MRDNIFHIQTRGGPASRATIAIKSILMGNLLCLAGGESGLSKLESESQLVMTIYFADTGGVGLIKAGSPRRRISYAFVDQLKRGRTQRSID